MGKQFDALNDKLIGFIDQQKMFFVATAAETGKVNISPKGMDSLRILSPTQLAWLNLTGSGNETAAHILKVPRITLMFCAFEGAPMILRLFGTPRAIHSTDSEWRQYLSLFPDAPAARQIFIVDLDMVYTSCGKTVPLYEYSGERDTPELWGKRHAEAGIEEYWAKHNQHSLDGFKTGILTNGKVSHD